MRPILFSIGPVHVYAYTVCMLTAVLVGGWLSYREAERRMRLDQRTLMVGSVGLVAGVLGAKVSMFIFLGPERFWTALPTLPAQGAALAGALFFGYAGVVLAERSLGVTRCTGDLVAPFLPLAQAIGRLGNLLAGDAYGNPTSLPWGITQAGAVRHPVQLYEIVLDLAVFAFLMWRRTRTYRDGELFRLYIIGYALIRFPLEALRYQPATPVWLGLTLVQWLCIGTVAFFGYQLILQRKGVACVCALFPRFRRGQTQA